MRYYVGNIAYGQDDIRHYGRLGMKWGQHIFTNDADTLLKNAPGLGKSQSTAFREGANIAGQYSRRSKPSAKVRKQLDSMSDAKLRDAVNRMNMERQYMQLTGADTRRGFAVAKDVLQTAGSVAAITTSALTSVLLLRKLMV